MSDLTDNIFPEETQFVVAGVKAIDEPLPDLTDVPDDSPKVPCEFICGVAGSGKTYTLKERITNDPRYAVIGSTTGVSAINLGTSTINSLLGYYNTDSLADNYRTGKLHARLRKIAASQVRNIGIDEISMMEAEQLDIIHRAVKETNDYVSVKKPLGLVVVGDFLQLAPVEGKRAFHAECWPEFEKNTTKLTKIWRQTDTKFLEGLNHLRGGDGQACLDTLNPTLHGSVEAHFDGMTLFGTNREVDRHNRLCLENVEGEPVQVGTARWGMESSEWDNIPHALTLKTNCLVMILANDPFKMDGPPEYVNGDLGHIEAFDGRAFRIRLLRNNNVVSINRMHRTRTTRDEPYDRPEEGWAEASGMQIPYGKVSYDSVKRVWHIGGIVHYPIRIGYGSSVHKSQGLTLDRVQVDFRGHFLGNPSSLYIALSRCRTLEGLRLVGSAKQFVERCKVDDEVRPWL